MIGSAISVLSLAYASVSLLYLVVLFFGSSLVITAFGLHSSSKAVLSTKSFFHHEFLFFSHALLLFAGVVCASGSILFHERLNSLLDNYFSLSLLFEEEKADPNIAHSGISSLRLYFVLQFAHALFASSVAVLFRPPSVKTRLSAVFFGILRAAVVLVVVTSTIPPSQSLLLFSVVDLWMLVHSLSNAFLTAGIVSIYGIGAHLCFLLVSMSTFLVVPRFAFVIFSDSFSQSALDSKFHIFAALIKTCVCGMFAVAMIGHWCGTLESLRVLWTYVNLVRSSDVLKSKASDQSPRPTASLANAEKSKKKPSKEKMTKTDSDATAAGSSGTVDKPAEANSSGFSWNRDLNGMFASAVYICGKERSHVEYLSEHSRIQSLLCGLSFEASGDVVERSLDFLSHPLMSNSDSSMSDFQSLIYGVYALQNALFSVFDEDARRMILSQHIEEHSEHFVIPIHGLARVSFSSVSALKQMLPPGAELIFTSKKDIPGYDVVQPDAGTDADADLLLIVYLRKESVQQDWFSSLPHGFERYKAIPAFSLPDRVRTMCSSECRQKSFRFWFCLGLSLVTVLCLLNTGMLPLELPLPLRPYSVQ
eukprot:ANDGO_03663.mRNA.1 hypothetical protein